MEKYIPIIDIDNIDYTKVIINNNNSSNNNIFNPIKYNFNDVYNNIDLKIIIKNCNLILHNKKNILTNNLKVIDLYNKLNDLILKNTINNTNINSIKLYFNKYISKAYLHPSKKSGKNSILVKSFEDFINIFSDYYAYSNNFNNKILVTGNIIFQPYYYNNKCYFTIYDADISYENGEKNIINNKIIIDTINITPTINL